MTQITLLTGERRRKWSEMEKRAMLDEAFAPGANTSAVAKQLGIASGQLYTWRAQARKASPPAFVEAVIQGERSLSPSVQVEFSSARVSIANSASPLLVETVLRALR
ncbi:hypothetical protein LTR94_024294 [Friedmanniomyces endolithicus]|nr:hypothetical protein LTR94_024294 [Friedmanniomyces endolithicus]